MNDNIYEYLRNEGFEREDWGYYKLNDKSDYIEDVIAEWARQNSTAYDMLSDLVFDSPAVEITCISLACADECGGVYSYLFTIICD
jgi:hypothetical protein